MIKKQAIAVVLMALFTTMLPGADRGNVPHVLGSYAVVRTTNMSPDTQVELRLRLVNSGAQAVSIEKLALRGNHPAPAQTLPAPILVGAHKSQEITQEFTIPAVDYRMWQKGLRPALRVEMRSEAGVRLRQTIVLNRMPLREEK